MASSSFDLVAGAGDGAGLGVGIEPFLAGLLAEALEPREVAAWPASSARGCHEFVTSHNWVDPGRAEGRATVGPAGLARVRSSALLLQESC